MSKQEILVVSDQKVKKKKIMMIILVRLQPIGKWEGGHMTKFYKKIKIKVVALNCSFQNLFKLCSKVHLLWRHVKDFSEHHFYFFIFLNFSIKPNHIILTDLER